MVQTKSLSLNPTHSTEIMTSSCEGAGSFRTLYLASQALVIIPPVGFAGLAGYMPAGNVGPYSPPKYTPRSLRVYGMQGGEVHK